ncbi:MAG: hypothetical protein PHE89_07800 [Alphaproteobacteria bacterium]|nr:hypothetical protein [Alphaproteobacteria bacterium]
MFKKLLTFSALVLFLNSCALYEGNEFCPRVDIKRNNAYIVQTSNVAEEFIIEMSGYEGYCFYDTRIKHDKAVITPIFKIKRIHPNDVSSVRFSYYTETVKGPPEYLGKKTYFANVIIPTEEKEIEYKAKPVEIRIPPNMKYEFDIFMGLNLSQSQKIYNQRTFDTQLEFGE